MFAAPDIRPLNTSDFARNIGFTPRRALVSDVRGSTGVTCANSVNKRNSQ